MVSVGDRINVYSMNYVNVIMRKYKETYGDLKKEILPMKVKEHPDLDNATLLNDKDNKEFQHFIGLYQWLIFACRFDLAYDVYSID